jgi:GxxExxY protein
MDQSELTGRIIGCALKVHSVLGPGLLESAYRICLVHDLKACGLETKTAVPLPVIYEGVRLDAGYRIDVLVESTVVLELKAVVELAPIHKAQLISYLKLGGFPVGLLSNFNVVHLRDGIRRVYPQGARQPDDRVEDGSTQAPDCSEPVAAIVREDTTRRTGGTGG